MTDDEIDIETKLLELEQARELAAEYKDKAEAIRDELLPLMEQAGPRYFINSDGVKLYGVYSETEEMLVDLDLLEAQAPEVYQDVVETERKVDKSRLKAAVATGRLPRELARKVIRYKPKSKTIRFGNPNDAASGSPSER